MSGESAWGLGVVGCGADCAGQCVAAGRWWLAIGGCCGGCGVGGGFELGDQSEIAVHSPNGIASRKASRLRWKVRDKMTLRFKMHVMISGLGRKIQQQLHRCCRAFEL